MVTGMAYHTVPHKLSIFDNFITPKGAFTNYIQHREWLIDLELCDNSVARLVYRQTVKLYHAS